MPPETDETPIQRPTGRLAAILISLGYLVLIFIAMTVVSAAVLVVAEVLHIVGPVVQLGQMTISLPVLAFTQLCVAVVAILVTLAFVLFVDHRPTETLGLNRAGTWKSELSVGIALGLGMVGVMFVVFSLAGWSRMTGAPISGLSGNTVVLFLSTLIFMTSVGVSEELVMRGYILQKLRPGYGAIGALILSSIFFGWIHSANPGASFPGFLGTASAGVLMGYAYLVTERLWMPIGIHFAWNLAEGPIFGFPVSGVDFPSCIHQNLVGPASWTGGNFGPEAGLMTPIVLILGALVVRHFRRTVYKSGTADHSTVSMAIEQKE